MSASSQIIQTAEVAIAAPPTVEPSYAEHAEVQIQEILSAYEGLAALTAYEVTDHAKTLFFQVYNIVSFKGLPSEVETKILEDARIIAIKDDLRRIMGELQCVYEEAWAQNLTAAESPELAHGMLSQYPGASAYETTVRMELESVEKVTGHFPSRIAMLGSGPLPMTAMGIVDNARQREQSMSILSTDIDPDRVEKSEKLMAAFGDEYACIKHMTADATYGPDLQDFDAVYVANMIGFNDEHREEILCAVASRMPSESVIILRTVVGLKTLLYPAIDLKSPRILEKIEPLLAVTKEEGDHNGSVVICRVKA